MAANNYTVDELIACIVRKNGQRLNVLIYVDADLPGLWLWNPSIDTASNTLGIQFGSEWEGPLAALIDMGKLVSIPVVGQGHASRTVAKAYRPA